MFAPPNPTHHKTSLWRSRALRSTLAHVSFVVISFVSPNLEAQPAPVAAPTKAAATNPADKPAPRQSRASVSRVAESIAADLAHVPAKALVVASPLTSDAPAPRGSELALLLATQLAGRRGAGSRAFAKPLALAEARIEARQSDALVMLKVEIAAGKLRAVADVFPVPRTVWARVRDPEPGPIAHAFAEAPIDAEVRTYLAPVPIAQVNVVRGQHFESDVVALGCADIDADGAAEIISVSRRRVTTLRLREGKVVPLRSRNWTDLSPLAPVPLREPIGLAAVVERPAQHGDAAFFVEVGLSDRSKSVRLDGQLDVVATLAGLPLGAGETSACVRVHQPWISGPLVPCAAGDRAIRVSLTGSYDAMASASLVTPTGDAFAVFAARTDRGVLEVRDDAGHATTVDGAGAQLAVGDLDQDGNPEILSSLDVPAGTTDAVVVRSWLDRSAPKATRPKEMLRVPAAAGVHAMAVCPPDGPGRAPFVVATADEIWVVR
ncbi:MAG: hypothetical protein IPM54_09480 [Polyangiaceae bacterium]|nr:hypothetical protein [Polyangiaceae bacterium]